jgi:phage-related protein
MATFPSYSPSYSATKNSQPKVRKTKFGDGYEQRLTFSLNQNPKEWQLQFLVADADATIIEAFLDAQGGQASFDWTAPDGTAGKKWVCEQWSRELYEFGRSKISTAFRQVFEP